MIFAGKTLSHLSQVSVHSLKMFHLSKLAYGKEVITITVSMARGPNGKTSLLIRTPEEYGLRF